MRTEQKRIAFGYYRLSREESQGGESGSISNQRSIVETYCKNHGIILVKEFVDDGFSGGNFERPGFQEMMRELEKGIANMVITKDLSRLGRGMQESSYYAEQFFPENNIKYIAISDNFDSEKDNKLAPFQFAMNDFYIRDGSSKVKEVLKNKRENGLYCACSPYGYKKDDNDINQLVPDENTAPIVKRIFEEAASGLSSHKIAEGLNRDGIIPPLKYRVLYRDKFCADGAARASDSWNHTTVKRYLKNQVYLGHTVLGKTKKASVKSKKKLNVPQEDWSITKNTHEPLVSEYIFERAQINLGKASKDFRQYDKVRESIFSGIAYCGLCGHALCSCGTVYKGEREKYWYLSCTSKRKDAAKPCDGVRIKYSELVQLITDELNSFIALNQNQIDCIVRSVMQKDSSEKAIKAKQLRREKLENRLKAIDNIFLKAYNDNAEGRLDDARLESMVENLQNETKTIKQELAESDNYEQLQKNKIDNYKRFFELTKKFSHIETLDRDTLLTFVERIEVGPKILPEGKKVASHANSPYEQSIRIFYKFVGEMSELN